MKQELSEAKKTLRERDREIAKLKSEVSQKKANGLVYPPPDNNSFSTKEANGEKTASKISNEQTPGAIDKDSIQA